MRISIGSDQMKGLEPLPVAVYDAEVTAVVHKPKAGEDPDPNHPGSLAVEFQVEDPEGRARKLTSYFALVETAKWKLGALVKATGIPHDELPNGAVDFDSDDLIGATCRIQVIQEQYQGRTVNRVDQVLPTS